MAKNSNYNQNEYQNFYNQLREKGYGSDQIVSEFNKKKWTTARGNKVTGPWLTRTFGGSAGSNNVAYKTSGRGASNTHNINRYATMGILNDNSLSDRDKVVQLRRLYTS